ncbi:MAG: phosphatidylserine decarboxylase [Rhodomicrobium sp.]
MSEPNALSQAKAILAPVNKDGYKFVAIGAGATLLGFYLWSPLGWICLAVTLALAFFFRDPYRVVPQRDGLIVAPADGVVISIEPVKPPVELNLGEEPRTRVSIFLSVLDVHVARAPLAGRIDASAHRPGIYKNAASPDAPKENERHALAIEAKEGVRLGVVLVAGYVARRIVTEVQIGDTVGAGQRIGLIRFGSRVDIYLPPAAVLVSEGQRTLAGETIVADMQSQEPARTFKRI